jgi:hypothetical protein
MVHLDMLFNGTVIVSEFVSNSSNDVRMIATTVRTPLDGEHPISGNRTWGIKEDSDNGGFYFFTTGADRISGNPGTVLNTWAERLPIFSSGLDNADKLWTSLQEK